MCMTQKQSESTWLPGIPLLPIKVEFRRKHDARQNVQLVIIRIADGAIRASHPVEVL